MSFCKFYKHLKIIKMRFFRLNEAEGGISTKDPVDIFIRVVDCSINYIEHVEFIVNVLYSRRGALQVHLESPRGE